MIAWWPGFTQDVQHFVSKCKNCQMNKSSLGKTVSTWPEANFWERGQKPTSVKIYLSQIFARFGIPKTLVSDNGPVFVSGDLKQWCESLGKKWNHPSITQELMD